MLNQKLRLNLIIKEYKKGQKKGWGDNKQPRRIEKEISRFKYIMYGKLISA